MTVPLRLPAGHHTNRLLHPDLPTRLQLLNATPPTHSTLALRPDLRSSFLFSFPAFNPQQTPLHPGGACRPRRWR
jgi:hypothetical protein